MRHKSSAAITILILASAEPGFFLQSIIIHLLAPNFMGFMKCVYALGLCPHNNLCAQQKEMTVQQYTSVALYHWK